MAISKTRLVTVNDVGDPEPITASIFCQVVTIGENPQVPGWPTTDWEYRQPEIADDAIGKPMGTMQQFVGVFQPGQVICYANTITGSTTFFVHEEQAISHELA